MGKLGIMDSKKYIVADNVKYYPTIKKFDDLESAKLEFDSVAGDSPMFDGETVYLAEIICSEVKKR
jgi:hypothetical protein